MPHSLDILETHLGKIKERNKLWKITNTVQYIEAFQCNISCIRVVGMFAKLMDLNIGGNPGLKSLRGIESCSTLKYLNCSNCDLDNIDELEKLNKLQTLNVTNNKRLDSIKSLAGHSELQNLFLSILRLT